ncbi:hypothetical protein [Halalkalicoccus salilacus]|uniref:hypothetical protein n=1 Tax=Halalkalicoccus sp. GCM10025704 TaxID=3252662 RepID=UPI00360E7CC8
MDAPTPETRRIVGRSNDGFESRFTDFATRNGCSESTWTGVVRVGSRPSRSLRSRHE